jgi:hypothetical protein
VFGCMGAIRSVDIVKNDFKFTGWCTHPIEMIYEVILRRVSVLNAPTLSSPAFSQSALVHSISCFVCRYTISCTWTPADFRPNVQVEDGVEVRTGSLGGLRYVEAFRMLPATGTDGVPLLLVGFYIWSDGGVFGIRRSIHPACIVVVNPDESARVTAFYKVQALLGFWSLFVVATLSVQCFDRTSCRNAVVLAASIGLTIY